jgi:AcrR family transcriptional regulator
MYRGFMPKGRGRKGSKEEQSRATQERLLAAARALFSERGFAGTATEDLVARAGVTRGALYHQYVDKRDLFRAVFEGLERELGERIAAAAAAEKSPWEMMRAGARALLDASLEPAIRRIVLTDGPSVLGWEEWRRIDGQYAYGMVRTALEANMEAGDLARQPIEPLAHLIIGALNEAGLAVAAAPAPEAARDQFVATLDGVLRALRAAARP